MVFVFPGTIFESDDVVGITVVPEPVDDERSLFALCFFSLRPFGLELRLPLASCFNSLLGRDRRSALVETPSLPPLKDSVAGTDGWFLFELSTFR